MTRLQGYFLLFCFSILPAHLGAAASESTTPEIAPDLKEQVDLLEKKGFKAEGLADSLLGDDKNAEAAIERGRQLSELVLKDIRATLGEKATDDEIRKAVNDDRRAQNLFLALSNLREREGIKGNEKLQKAAEAACLQ